MKPQSFSAPALAFAAGLTVLLPCQAEEPAAEWFGGDTSWTEWSRATGDWAGLRTRLEDRGVSLAGSYVHDWSAPLSGGLSRHGAARGLLDVNLTLETEPLIGLPGGQFFAQFLHHHGRDGSLDVGDLQAFSNIDADPFSKTYELWYQQELFDGKLRVKVGQVDANTEFAYVDAGGDLIHSSAGFTPTLWGFPTYTDPELSVNMFIHPTERLYFGAAVYGSTLDDGLDTGHPFWIGEAGVTWETLGQLGAGRFAAGLWHHSGDVDRLDGGLEQGTTGFYLLAEQRVWSENPDAADDLQGVDGFLQFGASDGAVNEFERHVGGGLRWIGPVPSRDADTLNLGANWVGLSDDPSAGFTADEWSVELNYVFQLTPFFRLAPDLQWIGNPGGDATADLAFVATLRAALDF
jgi:porin